MQTATVEATKPAFAPPDALSISNTQKKTGKGSNPNSRANLKVWQPGVSPNPGGRPKGSLNRLQGDFMAELADSFAKHGKSAIEAVIADKPHEFLKICASLMPKQLEVTTTTLDEMSLEQLEESLAALKRITAAPEDIQDVTPKLSTD